MKKILFPTDFSTCASNAFVYTQQLARKLRADVDLISIFNLPVSDASSVPPDFIQEMLDEKRSAIYNQLDAFAKEYPSATTGELIAEYGVFVYQEVTDKARDQQYDLIAMGTKGEHNAIEKLMGSVTSQMMMHASSPVLAIPEHAGYRPIKRIAFATDFFPDQKEAIQQLTTFAKNLSAQIEYVHIDTSGNGQTLEGRREEVMRKYGYSQFTLIQNKSLFEGIEDYLVKNSIDLLALFIPKRKLFERLFHNSFSKKMAFHSKIPLLSFR